MSGIIKLLVDDENCNFDKDVSIRLLKCGRERCLPDKKEEDGNRVYYSLHYVLRGEGYLIVDDEKMKVEKGNIFLIRANENIKYCQDRHAPWTYIWADFIGENLETMFEKCGLGGNTHFLKPKTSVVSEWFDEMLKNHFEKGLLLESTVIFMRILTRLIEENADNFPVAIHWIVREAIVFINNNYRRPLTLAIIAENIGVSPNYLVNLFSSEIGITPMKYLMMFRIANACDLIREKKYLLGEISNRVGYKDQLYFSRCFSSVKGIPPSEYIVKAKDDDPWEFIKKMNLDFDDRERKYL